MSDRDRLVALPCWLPSNTKAELVAYRDNDTKSFRLFVMALDGRPLSTADFTRQDAQQLGRALLDAAEAPWHDYD
jgi:formiminotetrahydrofolate cyclodeaminase